MKKIIVSDETIEQLVDEQLCAFVKKHFYDTYCNRREEMGYSEHQASEAVLMEFQLNFERKIRKAAINLIMHETIYRLSQEHGEESRILSKELHEDPPVSFQSRFKGNH